MVVYECLVDSLKQSKDTLSMPMARREHPNSIIHRIYESISKVQDTVECVSHDNGGLSTLIDRAILPFSSYISLKVGPPLSYCEFQDLSLKPWLPSFLISIISPASISLSQPTQADKETNRGKIYCTINSLYFCQLIDLQGTIL